MGWLLLVGVVIIASRWCKGPGARAPPRLPMPVSQRTNFWDFDPDFGRFGGRKKSPYFDYPTMLAVSGGLAPSFY